MSDLIPPDCESYQGYEGALHLTASACLADVAQASLDAEDCDRDTLGEFSSCEGIFTAPLLACGAQSQDCQTPPPGADDDVPACFLPFTLARVNAPDDVCATEDEREGCSDSIEQLTGHFDALSEGLVRVLPEWDEGPCFTSETPKNQNLRPGGTAGFKSLYVEFQGDLAGETIRCCPCWGRIDQSNNRECECHGEKANVEDLCGTPCVQSPTRRCMFCVSDFQPQRRCGLMATYSGNPID